MIDNNVIGTFELLEYCRKNITNVVIASTGGAIIGHETNVISEDRNIIISPGASKLLLRPKYAHNVNYGMKITCLRFVMFMDLELSQRKRNC